MFFCGLTWRQASKHFHCLCSGQTPMKRQDLPCTYLDHHEPESINTTIMIVHKLGVGMQGADCRWCTCRNKWCVLRWCLKLRLGLLPGLHPYQHPSHHWCLHHPSLCQWVSGWASGADPCAPHGSPQPGYAIHCPSVSFSPSLFHSTLLYLSSFFFSVRLQPPCCLCAVCAICLSAIDIKIYMTPV